MERRGIEIGLQLGVQQGKVELVMKLLNEKIGRINKTVQQQISKLSVEQLTEFGKALFDFNNAKDVDLWLKRVSQNN